eukprot:gnl/TRDRNA2_/TRDRNA2_148974_c1_seq1.p1 gnl/TRDRNA2_/TRDRNA2_148974_c1~~gnl/TRDRNA2_/TRDRNA2_148974_c1_seq1.p1  ORF type:complete len:158 (-),score=7.51 gnl/TRDRNA2_/TRDRNA2_148974_c1_seq1:124-597(-)
MSARAHSSRTRHGGRTSIESSSMAAAWLFLSCGCCNALVFTCHRPRPCCCYSCCLKGYLMVMKSVHSVALACVQKLSLFFAISVPKIHGESVCVRWPDLMRHTEIAPKQNEPTRDRCDVALDRAIYSPAQLVCVRVEDAKHAAMTRLPAWIEIHYRS